METTSHNNSHIQRRRKGGRSSTDASISSSREICKEDRALMNKIFNTKNIIKVGTWNVCTSFQAGRMDQALKEMKAYCLDVMGAREIRWTGQGQFHCNGINVLCSGHEDQPIHGVGIILSKEASQALIGWEPVINRLITTKLNIGIAKVTIVQIYTPTDSAETC
ncbi:uncharacterized protein LOC106872445 [Octopus bimaculoides]|uniref:uncharacterized protein LOC106872445 n=1 Tax=Octopus bimaculoides TaxID=37653 RepID=UPI00071C922C|nr:uncharacterized protein LOC106872445 [Octopus bimaculoides]|eukprot:XP_014774934.1 PREDICTED: uncharacterized protein LOC106872445 [Octopus bimaculoides]